MLVERGNESLEVVLRAKRRVKNIWVDVGVHTPDGKEMEVGLAVPYCDTQQETCKTDTGCGVRGA